MPAPTRRDPILLLTEDIHAGRVAVTYHTLQASQFCREETVDYGRLALSLRCLVPHDPRCVGYLESSRSFFRRQQCAPEEPFLIGKVVKLCVGIALQETGTPTQVQRC